MVGISPNLNSLAGHTQRTIMGENQVDGINGACNGNSGKEINNDERRSNVVKQFTRNTPPPLPPRKYRTKGLPRERLGLKDHANNSITPELTVPQGLPSKENSSSFDSMEAFSGSNENMTVNSAANGKVGAKGIPEEVYSQEWNTREEVAEAASTGHNVATLSVQLEETIGGQSETDDIQTDGPVTPTERAQNKTEPFDESGATSESYESATESMGTSEKTVLQTVDSSVKSHNNACTAAGSFVTSIAAQLARIPTIESAVSERACCPTGVKQQGSIESQSEDSQQMSTSMHDSVYSSSEAGVPSTGANAHLVVTAQPTGHETSRPVHVGVAHSHAVPLTAVVPVVSELHRQDSSSSDHSDANNQQGLTKHTSVHMQRINSKHKQSPPQNRVAVVKPVPAPRNVNRQGSQELLSQETAVFTFNAGSSGSSDNAATVQQEDEPLSPRRKLLSDQERQQNRQQIQEQLARWHQRRQTGVSPPHNGAHQEVSPLHTSSSGGAVSTQGPSQQASPSPTATQPTVQRKGRTFQGDLSHEQVSAAPSTTSVMSNVSLVLNTNSSMSSRNTQPTRETRQPPPPPPRDGSTLSTPALGPVVQANSVTAPVTGATSAIPLQPPPRDGSSLSSNENQPAATTVSSMTTVPFAMTTVLTTGHTNTVSQPTQQSVNQVTTITQRPANQLSMHISNNNRDFVATREAIQQRLLQWHQQQQQLHRQNSGQIQHHSAQNIPTSLPNQQHSLNHPVLPQLLALQQQGRSNHQVRNLYCDCWNVFICTNRGCTQPLVQWQGVKWHFFLAYSYFSYFLAISSYFSYFLVILHLTCISCISF